MNPMPPKVRALRSHGCEGKSCTICTNPRVVLRPLGDPLVQTCYRFTTTPPIASLFKRPEFSDIKIKVGDDVYYAHRLVLCSASDVFAKMLSSNWSEGHKEMLTLDEEDECIKVFDRFLKYMYSGCTVISESYVIPLFMLSDKYDVAALYEECVKVIENGLKVYTAPMAGHEMFALQPGSEGLPRSGSDTSDDFSNDLGQNNLVGDMPQAMALSDRSSPIKLSGLASRLHLVASETFSLGMVMKLLSCCSNQRILEASLYNLEARLSNQIMVKNYIIWNDLDQNLIIQMLQDNNFYCDEFVLFRAAKSWVEYDESRQCDAIKTEVLTQIRYPVMEASQLYEIENDSIVKNCEKAMELVHQAIRYKLFCQFSRPDDQKKWTGPLYQQRVAKNQ